MKTFFLRLGREKMSRRAGMRCALLLWCIVCSTVVAQDKPDPFFAPRSAPFSPVDFPSAQQISSPNLLQQIGTDFKNVFITKENLTIVAVGAGATWGASYFDEQIVSKSVPSEIEENTTVDNFFEAGQHVGGIVQFAGAFATFGLGRLLSKPSVERLGRDLVRAQVVAQTFTFALKLAVARPRPDGSSNKSFPSGHASGTFATATVLQRNYGWKVGVPAYAVAGYVGCSRLNEGRHYLSDVVFGATLGFMAGRTVTIDRTRTRLTIAPAPDANGIEIQLKWL
ncbi:MAG: phosphatase PAP2 family protein [bacterium]